MVIRESDAPERLVEESAVPTEAALHEVLMRHPELIPASDLGFDRVATVGFEVGLAAGSADLVLLDSQGRVCIVEVKKAGNPDTRRVVAQLLDYAAALWGLTIEQFERDVLQRTLGANDPRTLVEFITEDLLDGADEPEDAAERVIEALGETLRTGDFALVVAAPTIPAGVQRVIEYLNARGHSVFGLEVSYFAGEVEAFVPRIVVRPSLGGRIAGQDAQRAEAPTDKETFLTWLPEAVRAPVEAFIKASEASEGELRWRSSGPQVRIHGTAGPKVMVSLDEGHLYLTIGEVNGLDPELGERVAAQMRTLQSAKVGTYYATFRWADADPGEVERALAVASVFIRDLLGDVHS